MRQWRNNFWNKYDVYILGIISFLIVIWLWNQGADLDWPFNIFSNNEGQEAVTSLFAGLAFWGVLFTLFIQRKELQETQRTMDLQRFETTFFNLISYNKNHLKELYYIKEGEGRFQGVEALIEITSSIKKNMMEHFGIKENEKKLLDASDVIGFSTKLVEDIPLQYMYRYDSYVRSFKSIIDLILNENKKYHSKYFEILDSLIFQGEFDFICYYTLLKKYKAIDIFILNTNRPDNGNFVLAISSYKEILKIHHPIVY